MRWLILPTGLAAALVVGACVPSGTPLAGPGVAPGPSPSVVAPRPEAQPAVDAALRDAASRLGVPSGQLTAERVERREWSDTSLGCPQPGMLYAQVVTPGYFIVVSGAGRQLEYHTDTRGRVVLCREA